MKIPGLFVILLFHTSILTYAQGVSINTSGNAPTANAFLDISSTSKGILIPRMTTAQRTAITPVAGENGLLIYDTDTDSYWFHDGAKWVFILSNSTSNNGGWSLTGNTGTVVGTHFLGTSDAEDLALYTNGSERIRIDQNGKVGIGNTSPQVRLHLDGDGSEAKIILADNYGVASQIRLRNANGTSAAPTAVTTGQTMGNFAFTGYGATGFLTSATAAIKAISAENFTDVAGGTHMNFQTTQAGTTTLSERLRITDTGNVGIGTSSPDQQLHIKSNVGNAIHIETSVGNGNDSHVRLRKSRSNGVITSGDFLGEIEFQGHDGTSFTTGAYIRAISSGTVAVGDVNGILRFGTDGISRMTIDNAGNIGIGTSSPTNKLHVNGRITTNGISETSDVRLKKEVKTLTKTLKHIKDLRGVSYQWKLPEELTAEGIPGRLSPELNDVEIGLIAQEVERVFPELVSTDSEGYKSVQYSKLVAVLIEAVKELDQEKASLKEQVDQIANRSSKQEILYVELLKANEGLRSDIKNIKEVLGLMSNK